MNKLSEQITVAVVTVVVTFILFATIPRILKTRRYKRQLALFTKRLDESKSLEERGRVYASRASFFENNFEYFYLLGQIPSIERAIVDWGCAIELCPNDADYLSSRGECYLALRNFDSALIDLTKSIEIRPSPKTYWQRAQLFLDRKQFESTIQDCTAGIEIAGEDKVLHILLSEVMNKAKRAMVQVP